MTPHSGGARASDSKLDRRSLGRLVIMQLNTRRYSERRTEHVALKDKHHYAVRVDHQFTVPSHGDGDGTGTQDLLIPLGNFAKDRLPDLVVTGPDGARVPVLGRAARGEAVATLFGSQWQHVIFEPELEPSDLKRAEDVWSVVQLAIARIVTRPSADAERLVPLLERFLREQWVESESDLIKDRLEALIDNDVFWSRLRDLVRVRLLVARFEGVPGRTYVLTTSYTEAMGRDYYGTGRLRRFLAWLGLIASPISRQAANGSQAASFWTMATAPSGVEILRMFWQSDRDEVPGEESISIDANRAWAGRYEWSNDDAEQNELLIDVQIAPSASVVGTVGLAAILLYFSRYVYQGFPRPELTGASGLSC